MTPEDLRRHCLSLGAATSDVPFPSSPGLTVFRVMGKIFAFCALEEEPLKVSLKCDPDEAGPLRETYPAIVPGYHLNKRHWNTVTVDDLPDRFVRELVDDSYDLVVSHLPRTTRHLLDRP